MYNQTWKSLVSDLFPIASDLFPIANVLADLHAFALMFTMSRPGASSFLYIDAPALMMSH